MPVRLGQFYAFVLLFGCLATNIAFFSEVREPFLGDSDHGVAINSALSELDIQDKIAAFYPKVSPNVVNTQSANVQNVPLPNTIGYGYENVTNRYP